MVIFRGDKNKLYEKYLRDYLTNIQKMLGEKTLDYEDEIINFIIRGLELIEVTLLTSQFRPRPNTQYIC